MIVTLICDVLGEKNNGTTLAANNLIDYLKSQNHEVRIVCCDKDKNNEPDYYITPTLNLGKFCNKIVEKNGVTLAKADEAVLRKAIVGADVVHLLIPFTLSRKAIKIARETNKPITASFHCQAENVTAHVFLMNLKFANTLVYKNFYNHVYKYCDIIHYPTSFIRDVFEKTTHKTNSIIISNGVNKQFFQNVPPKRVSDKFTIVCTGRYSKEKAQYLLIRAIGQCKYKNNIKVVFAGAGPYEERLKKLAKKYDVDADFKFYSRDELLPMLKDANLYVHTAAVEIEAIACLEAIVSGLVPVINNSPRSATTAFALDDNNLFSVNNFNDLTKKVEFWYENPELINQYKANYKSIISAFDQQECMRKMERMLLDAIEKKGNAHAKTEDNIL